MHKLYTVALLVVMTIIGGCGETNLTATNQTAALTSGDIGVNKYASEKGLDLVVASNNMPCPVLGVSPEYEYTHYMDGEEECCLLGRKLCDTEQKCDDGLYCSPANNRCYSQQTIDDNLADCTACGIGTCDRAIDRCIPPDPVYEEGSVCTND